ncbi:MAG: hypothetical protein JF588_11545 [Caulobacterales bacterium]|nr:hypothetical protein [Caulobacterales bacterium]
MRALILATLALAWAPLAAAAAVLPATPATVATVLPAAHCGDVVQLAPGDYPALKLPPLACASAPLLIDASASAKDPATGAVTTVRVTAPMYWRGVQGLTLKGGTWSGIRFDNFAQVTVDSVANLGPPEANGTGLAFNWGQGAYVRNSNFGSWKAGLVFFKVDGFKAEGVGFSRNRSDGIDIAQSWRGLVDGAFIGGTEILSTEHPDCVQLWSRPDAPPTSDITIRNVRCQGVNEGVNGTNHTRIEPAGYRLANGTVLAVATPIDDGGFDRIVIEGNDIVSAFPSAAALNGGRASIIRNNHVATYPRAPYPAHVVPGPGVTTCGNVTVAYANTKAVTEAPCSAAPVPANPPPPPAPAP